MTTLPWRKVFDTTTDELSRSPTWNRNLILGSFRSLGMGNWPASWRAFALIKEDMNPRGPRRAPDWMTRA